MGVVPRWDRSKEKLDLVQLLFFAVKRTIKYSMKTSWAIWLGKDWLRTNYGQVRKFHYKSEAAQVAKGCSGIVKAAPKG